MSPDEMNKIIESARLGFGHIEGRSDLEVLCLRISQLDRLSKERLAECNFATQRARALEVELEKYRVT